METWQIAVITIVVAAFVVIIGGMAYERIRSRQLRERFGGEYDRRVTEIGSRRRAEAELRRREARVHTMKGRPLGVSDRERFVERWRICQARFVDAPTEALDAADHIVADIMHARGYMIDEPEDRLADLCAAYPERAAEFREAHEINNQRGHVTTEELRKAFVHFRALFDEMLGGQNEELKRAS